MHGCQARMAHDTFTLSPRLGPAPALLLLAQGMVPHPGKEGRHLPAAQPGTDALRQDPLVPWAPHRKADAHRQH